MSKKILTAAALALAMLFALAACAQNPAQPEPAAAPEATPMPEEPEQTSEQAPP